VKSEISLETGITIQFRQLQICSTTLFFITKYWGGQKI